jgi:hypothetical protein
VKKIFIKQLLDFLSCTINKNNWDIEVAGEQTLKELIERSVDKVYHSSFEDCSREEMQQFAKTNLSSLLAYMHIDCLKRNVPRLDSASVYNALRNFTCLWPFKGKEVNSANKYSHVEKTKDYEWYY